MNVTDLDKFLAKLSSIESNALISNQYREKNCVNNLRAYLSFLKPFRPSVLVLGEAPGYRGCRRTGIPFASGSILARSPCFRPFRSQLRYNQNEHESTAQIVFKTVDQNPQSFLKMVFWNAFPFHPHLYYNDKTNRPPDLNEIKLGAEFILFLNSFFTFRQYIGIGKVAFRLLTELYPGKAYEIRHPSNGGKPEFQAGWINVWKEYIK